MTREQPIRIMHVVDTLEMGGLENGVVNLIGRMNHEGFEHIVCAVRNLGPLADRLPTDRVKIICLGKTGLAFSSQLATLTRVIREAKPHIVHSRNWGAIEAVVAGRWSRSCALIHSEHGIESVDSRPEPRRRRWFRRVAFELADQVFAVSQQLRTFHSQTTGFPASRIAVIHNGVDTQRFCPTRGGRTQARQLLGIRSEDFCIGSVGRVEPVKDLLTLLFAVAELPPACANWRVLIAGEGSELPMLQQFASGRPTLRDRIVFLGEIRNTPEFLKALDVYVLPSLSEGISNSLLEAMATALPVVASAAGGNPEVVGDGESGLLFPAGDFRALAAQILRVHQEYEVRVHLAQRAMERVKEHFSMESMVGRYERLYSSVVLGRKSSPEAQREPPIQSSRDSERPLTPGVIPR